MADVFSKMKRSEVMSRIRGRDTKPELELRSLLHKAGLRFRVHVRSLPGTPDVVMSRHRTVVELRGCFWHRHARCRFAYVPKSRQNFWSAKFAANVARDRRTEAALRALGWHVLIVWECEMANPELVLGRVLRHVQRQNTVRTVESPPARKGKRLGRKK